MNLPDRGPIASVPTPVWRVALLLSVFQVIPGATFMVAKVALREFDPLALGVLRFVTAGLVFALLLVFRGEWHLPRVGHRWRFLFLAALAVPLNQGLFLYGMTMTFSTHGALLYAVTPVLVLLFGVLEGRERVGAAKGAGLLLSLAGVTVVLLERGLAWEGATLTGDLLIAGAVLTWAAYLHGSQPLLKEYSPLYVTAVCLMTGGVLFLPVGVPFLGRVDPFLLSGTAIAAFLYLSLLTSVVAYLIWAWGLARLEASKVAVVSNLQPAIAAVLAWGVLGEPITGTLLVGTGCVIAGVFLTQTG